VIVLSPTDKWLREVLGRQPRSIVVASPYVGVYLSRAVSGLENGAALTLLTRTLLTDFASNASDLEAVTTVARQAGSILSLSSLHAKVYVVDDRTLITSANATVSGMLRNIECGFEVKNTRRAAEMRRLIKNGFGSRQRPEIWTPDELMALHEPVERLRASLPKRIRLQSNAIEAPPRVQLPRRDYSRLVESFRGWLRLTMEGISAIRADVFTMADVFAACAPRAAAEFPDNRHVREKLRQQMQRLRDLGLVAFLGSGQYELLARPR
jgi:Dam-replacing HTH domain/PLD-like domain